MVAINTPFALWSLLIFKNPKKAIKLRMAPKANRLPMCSCATAASKVSVILKSENKRMYNKICTRIKCN